MLQAGIKGKKEITVTLDKTAKAMGSGTMDVFATPAMIALMENTAFESVASELEEVQQLFRCDHSKSAPFHFIKSLPDPRQRQEPGGFSA